MTPTEAKTLALVAVSKIEAKSATEQRQRDAMRQAMLTDQEAEALILALLRTRGPTGATEQEATNMLNECITFRFMATCVDLAAKGLIDVDINTALPLHDQLVFKPRVDIDGTLREVMRRRESGEA